MAVDTAPLQSPFPGCVTPSLDSSQSHVATLTALFDSVQAISAPHSLMVSSRLLSAITARTRNSKIPLLRLRIHRREIYARSLLRRLAISSYSLRAQSLERGSSISLISLCGVFGNVMSSSSASNRASIAPCLWSPALRCRECHR